MGAGGVGVALCIKCCNFYMVKQICIKILFIKSYLHFNQLF
uniref:Uncharacterized protein n=1 Tax=Anguilla anguilla TaxID=7936 RepID=A0A0E9QAL3_ANGAN